MSGSGNIQFNKNITLDLGRRLDHLDCGPVKAYAGRGKDTAPENLFVLLCEEELTPRSSIATKYASVINPSLAKLVACGPVYIPEEKRKRYALVYQNNLGRPVVEDDVNASMGWKAEDALRIVVEPMINAFTDLRNKNIYHGNVRPSNMYDGGSSHPDHLTLGECLSVPASYNLPPLFETIERSIADPIGRGEGIPDDDLYAFGVSLAILLRTNNPLAGLSDDQILERKIEQGSYSAILGSDRFTGAILELLRGLLFDDCTQRWTLEEVQAWMDGRRLSPKQSVKKVKASRPIQFNEKSYLRPELLACDLHKNPSEVVKIIDNDTVKLWMHRAIDNKPLEANVEEILKMASEASRDSGYADNLATDFAIALYPEAPIHYKTICMIPDGIGKALTQAYLQKKDVDIFQELLAGSHIMQWVDKQTAGTIDARDIIKKFDSCRTFLRQPRMGFGIERCIYLLNPESPCLSEKIRRYYVRSPEDLMHAFEDLSQAPDRPLYFMDKHIAAFMSVKDRKDIDSYIADINSEDNYRRILGEMRILASIQKRARLPKFPGISAWIVDSLDPVYGRFHDRASRKALETKMQKLRDKGDLEKIAALLENPDLYENDRNDFKKAMRIYKSLEQEAKVLEHKMAQQGTFGRSTGQKLAAVISFLLALIVIAGSFFLAFYKGISLFS